MDVMINAPMTYLDIKKTLIKSDGQTLNQHLNKRPDLDFFRKLS